MLWYSAPVNRSNKKRRLKSVTIRMIKKYNTNTSKVPANNTRNSGVSASKLKTSMSVSKPSGIQLKYAVMRIPLSTVRIALLSLNSTPNLSKALPSVFPLMSGTKAKYNANNAETGMVVFKKLYGT